MKIIIRALLNSDEIEAGASEFSEIDADRFVAEHGVATLERNLNQRWAWNVAAELGVETSGPAVMVRF